MRGALAVALWFFVLGAIDVHVLGIYALLAIITAIAVGLLLMIELG